MVILRFFTLCFLYIMCALAAGIADARTLHVGNKSFALSQTKYTTPSLAFDINNEVWYGTLITAPLTDTLHIKYNNTTYSLCEPFTDTENYTYDEDGRLIGANENLWVKSNGGFINSGFTANNDTRLYAKVNVISSVYSGFWFISRSGISHSDAYGFFCDRQYNCRTDYGNAAGTNIRNCSCQRQGVYIIDKNKNTTTIYHPNGNTYSTTQTYRTFSTPNPLFIMAQHTSSSGKPAAKETLLWYYVKLYDNGNLVRDMVPVPACMRIGDFIVPENGMWDIVEQKFYGNANTTGTIIYGKDE